jgi:hypothetical protein
MVSLPIHVMVSLPNNVMVSLPNHRKDLKACKMVIFRTNPEPKGPGLLFYCALNQYAGKRKDRPFSGMQQM